MHPATAPSLKKLDDESPALLALVKLGGVLANSMEPLEDRLRVCINELARLARAEQASLMLLEGDELVVAAATNPRLLHLRTPLEQDAISTQVARSGQPIFLRDVAATPLAPLSRQGDMGDYRTPSLICLPLMEDTEMVGVLNLSDKEGAAHFTPTDLALMQHVAQRVTVQIRFSALHERLVQAYAELSQAKREREDLMYTIIHDMKAPLTAVEELLGLVKEQDDSLSSEERRQYLSMAEGDLELLWRRITNLLDLTRMDQGRLPLDPVPLGLGELSAEVARRMQSLSAQRPVTLTMLPGDDPQVMADEDLLERILVNLLMNAVKFSSPEHGGGGRVQMRVAARGDQAWVEITDSGPGVDPAVAQIIFDRFTRASHTRGSTGLGLFFCRRAAGLLGGEVSYRNLPQGGALFSLRLPVATARAVTLP